MDFAWERKQKLRGEGPGRSRYYGCCEHDQGFHGPSSRGGSTTRLRELGKVRLNWFHHLKPIREPNSMKDKPLPGRAIPFVMTSSGSGARGPAPWILLGTYSVSTSDLLNWKNSERTRVYPFRVDEGVHSGFQVPEGTPGYYTRLGDSKPTKALSVIRS